jgi:hypothetical protein
MLDSAIGRETERLEALRAERAELEGLRDDLRATIEREAREHDLEPRTLVTSEGHSGARFKRALEGRNRTGDAASELERLRRIAGEPAAWSGDAPAVDRELEAGNAGDVRSRPRRDRLSLHPRIPDLLSRPPL